MAKRIIINRQEIELTDKEAKEYILEHMFVAKGFGFRVEDFASRAQSFGLGEGMFGDFERLINELIKEGKARIEYEHVHAGPASGYVLFIKRIA